MQLYNLANGKAQVKQWLTKRTIVSFKRLVEAYVPQQSFLAPSSHERAIGVERNGELNKRSRPSRGSHDARCAAQANNNIFTRGRPLDSLDTGEHRRRGCAGGRLTRLLRGTLLCIPRTLAVQTRCPRDRASETIPGRKLTLQAFRRQRHCRPQECPVTRVSHQVRDLGDVKLKICMQLFRIS